uniref:Glycosyl hydrolases family 22 (GH22) domain-containing protein n=1 Tax=Stomoxys calcitrans TaxID=35570 RepID=A0A1I8Q0F1_STOCA
MKFFIVLVAALAMAAPAFGRTMTRCSLAREIPTNSNGSNDYGIFQINNYYWCQPANGRFSYNECKLSCNNLLTDSINDSVTCARKIKSQQGWTAWSTWKYCSGSLPSINDCF